MKFTNVKQLIIKFMGGGIINFPTRFLRWVKINGDSDSSDEDGGGSSDTDINQEIEFLNQIIDLIYQTNGFIFDADSQKSYCVPISDYEDSWSEGTTILGDKENADYVIWVTDENRQDYTVFLTEEEYNFLEDNIVLYYIDWKKCPNSFPLTGYLDVYKEDNYIFCYEGNGEFTNYNFLSNININEKTALLGQNYKISLPLLGKEFEGENTSMFETPTNKFTFDASPEGNFPFFKYDISTNDMTNQEIKNYFNSLNQKIYKAGETNEYETYLVQLSGQGVTEFYTIYIKYKTIS